MKKFPVFLIIFILAGCATTSPLKYYYQSEGTYDAAYDEVFDVAVSFINETTMTIKTAEISSGTVVSEEFKVPYEGFLYKSSYCDCGSLSGLKTYHEIIGKFYVYIENLENDKISVHVETEYRASLWSGKDFKGWVDCVTKGYLEQAFFRSLHSGLRASAR